MKTALVDALQEYTKQIERQTPSPPTLTEVKTADRMVRSFNFFGDR